MILETQLYKLASIIKFPNEFAHFYNLKKNTSNEESILFFTTYKCASSFAPAFFNFINEKYLNRSMVNYASFVYNYDSGLVYDYLAEHKNVFKPKGCLYTPLRRFISIDNIDKYKTILMLRDPRDVLVSHFFSSVFSHPIPKNPSKKKRFLEVRNKYADKTVDDFVVDYIEFYHKIFDDYKIMKEQNENILFVKYEELIEDFDSWYNKIADYLDFPVEQESINKAKAIGGFDKEVSSENIGKHIRSRKAGDYKNKLRPETIELVEDKFKDIIEFFNY